MANESAENIEYVIGNDVGGTFTDTVAIDTRGKVYYAGIYSGKAFTTPKEIADGVIKSLDALATEIGVTLEELMQRCIGFTHGTTTGTNMIIERSGARVGLITTRGFEDTIYIQRAIGRLLGLELMEKKHQATARKPKPLVPKELIAGISERMDCNGEVVIPMKEKDARQSIQKLIDKEVEAVAVCTLWSFMNPAHENRIVELGKEMAPDVHWVSSYEILPKIRENARMNTTIMDAYSGNVINTYLADINNKIKNLGFRGDIRVMQIFGGSGLIGKIKPCYTLDSGPVACVTAAQYMSTQLGINNFVITDMGGTSFDVAIAKDRKVPMFRHLYGAGAIIGRFETLLPKVDIRSVGAGGGTIAWVDDVTNTVKLGPMSAGSDPGPACYDRGGVEPTVTDANMVLGYIDPGYFLGGKIKLRKDLAEKAIQDKIARRMGWDVYESASAIYRIISARMGHTIRSMVLERGYDPRSFTCLISGGAGPCHAVEFMKPTSIPRIVMIATAAAFSAFGMATADIERNYSRSILIVEPWDIDRINRQIIELEDMARSELKEEGFTEKDIRMNHSVEVKFRGAVHEVVVNCAPRFTGEKLAEFRKQFIERYEEEFGKGAAWESLPLELLSVNLHAMAVVPTPNLMKSPPSGKDPSAALKGNRDTYWEGDFVNTPIFEHELLENGNVVEGPAIVEHTKTTFVIPPSYTALVDEYKNLIIEVG